MRLSLFFFLHLVAFVILLIVHPHARAQDDGWAIIEKDKDFIYMSKNGEFIHGDRIVLSLNYKDCDTVYHLFTFLTTKGDANIYQFENQNIPIKINNFDFFAKVTHIEKILDHSTIEENYKYTNKRISITNCFVKPHQQFLHTQRK